MKHIHINLYGITPKKRGKESKIQSMMYWTQFEVQQPNLHSCLQVGIFSRGTKSCRRYSLRLSSRSRRSSLSVKVTSILKCILTVLHMHETLLLLLNHSSGPTPSHWAIVSDVGLYFSLPYLPFSETGCAASAAGELELSITQRCQTAFNTSTVSFWLVLAAFLW